MQIIRELEAFFIHNVDQNTRWSLEINSQVNL